MPLSPLRAAALAARLDLSLDGVCLACLSFVSASIRDGDVRGARTWLGRMTPDLWDDGLDELAPVWVRAACDRGVPDAAEGLGDLERQGSRSALAREIVRALAESLAEAERAWWRAREEVSRFQPGSTPELN